MTATVEKAKYSEEMLTAVERALQSHDLRLKAGILPETVLDTMTANQCEVAVLHGQLAVSMHGAPVHAQNVIEGLARDRQELFFPRDAEVGAVKSKDALDVKGRVAFIKNHGLEAFERLPQQAPQSQPVCMSPRTMTRTQYAGLPRQMKAEFLKEFGAAGVSQVMGRVK